MHPTSLFPFVIAITLSLSPALAGPRVLKLNDGAHLETTADFENYRGYMFDLSDFADRKDAAAITDNLRRQLDVVESVGLSPKTLKFFHTIPIVASEMDCLEESAAAACYGSIVPGRGRSASLGITTWDESAHQWTNPDILELAADSGRGVITLRPNLMQYAQDPVLLHEFLHAFHARLLPSGYDNSGVKNFYGEAKAKNLFEKNAYVAKNHKEFFAVTASIFLAGKDSTHEPNTRANLKEKMPNYYKYLVGVFGFDPEPDLPDTPLASAAPAAAVTPVASAAPVAPATPPARVKN